MFIRSLVALLCVGVLLGDVHGSHGKQPAGETDEATQPLAPASQVPSLRFLAFCEIQKDPVASQVVLDELPEVIHREAPAIVKAFLKSEDGKAAWESFKINLSDNIWPKCKFSASLGLDNVAAFVNLQEYVSPVVRGAIKAYLALEKGPEEKRFLECLSIDFYRGPVNLSRTNKPISFTTPFRYISPLLLFFPVSDLIIEHWAMAAFPKELAQNPTLNKLSIYHANLSEPGSMDALLGSPLSTRITSLFFENSQLPANFADILKRMPCITHLFLKNIAIKGGWDTVWTSLLKTLKTLTLKNLGLPELPILPPLPSLFRIDLQGNKFTGYPHRYMGLPMSPRWDGVYERKKMKDLPPLKGIPFIHYLFSSEPTQSPAR